MTWGSRESEILFYIPDRIFHERYAWASGKFRSYLKLSERILLYLASHSNSHHLFVTMALTFLRRGCHRSLNQFGFSRCITTSTCTSSKIFLRSTNNLVGPSPWIECQKARLSSTAAPSLASLVKELRERTGAPMMECKKALKESDNDMDGALDWLRTYSSAKLSSKLEGRSAGTEGMVGLTISDDGTKAAIVELTSETDFACRSDTFACLLQKLTQTALNMIDPTTENFSNQYVSHGKTVQQALEEAKLAIRENIQIAKTKSLSNKNGGVWAGYVHNKSPHSESVGSTVAMVHVQPLSGEKTIEEMTAIGKKLAMHVVAAKPLYLSPDTVPPEVLAKEKDLLREQILNAPKPPKPEMVDKILDGRLNKLFYSVQCLTEQEHMVEDDNPRVSKYLDSLGVKVTDFQLVTTGV